MDLLNPKSNTYGNDGSVSAPSYSFFNDADTGWFRKQDGTLGLASNSVETISVGTDLTLTNKLVNSNGNVSNPSITFSSDSDTGIYRIGTDNIGVSCGGIKVLDISSSGLTVLNASNQFDDGTEILPSISNTSASSGLNFDATSNTSMKLTESVSTAIGADIAWSPSLGLFCAVKTALCNTSPDGITWTLQSIGAGTWQGICWATDLSLFVAVGTNCISTSPDGVVWTGRTSPENCAWNAVVRGISHFVAVASSGTNRIMYSTDGITWSVRSATATNSWIDVVYASSLSMYIAIASSGTNRVMTCGTDPSVAWSAQSIGSVAWSGLEWCASLGLLVTVGTSAVSTSSNGTTWTSGTGIPVGFWRDIAWSPESSQFLIVPTSSGANIMTSKDGVSFYTQTGFSKSISSVVWSPSLSIFCAVCEGVLTGFTAETSSVVLVQSGLKIMDVGNHTILMNAKVEMPSLKVGGNVFLPTSGGTSTAFNYYEELAPAAFTWSISGGSSGARVGNLGFVRIGNTTTLDWRSLNWTSMAGASFVFATIPVRFTPIANMYFTSIIWNGVGDKTLGQVMVATDSTIRFYYNLAQNPYPSTFTYLIENSSITFSNI